MARQSAKDIFSSLIRKSTSTDEDNNSITVDRNTFYRSLMKYLKIVYKKTTFKEIEYVKLSSESYNKIIDRFVEFAEWYSLDKIDIWTKKIKTGSLLYNIDEKTISDKCRQIKFYMESRKLMLEIYSEENNEYIGDSILNKFKLSREVYRNILDEIGIEINEGNFVETESVYTDKSLEELQEMLEELPKNKSMAETDSEIDYNEKKMNIIFAMLDKEELKGEERRKATETLTDIRIKSLKMNSVFKQGEEIFFIEKMKRAIQNAYKEGCPFEDNSIEEIVYYECVEEYYKKKDKKKFSANKMIRKNIKKVENL